MRLLPFNSQFTLNPAVRPCFPPSHTQATKREEKMAAAASALAPDGALVDTELCARRAVRRGCAKAPHLHTLLVHGHVIAFCFLSALSLRLSPSRTVLLLALSTHISGAHHKCGAYKCDTGRIKIYDRSEPAPLGRLRAVRALLGHDDGSRHGRGRRAAERDPRQHEACAQARHRRGAARLAHAKPEAPEQPGCEAKAGGEIESLVVRARGTRDLRG